MKHICIFICYLNKEHIQECYDTCQTGYTDFFIIENKSERSKEIEAFFKKRKPFSYIQFEQNITNNALNIFIKDYKHLLSQYDYITFSDCDLRLYNIKNTFQEIFNNLSFPEVMVSCVDLQMGNLPNVPGADSWIPAPKDITDDFIECATGVQLMTIRNKDLFLFDNIHFKDHLLVNKVNKLQKKWVKTKINKAYHLTWDLYYEGNPYYHFKKDTSKLWNHKNYCAYRKII